MVETATDTETTVVDVLNILLKRIENTVEPRDILVLTKAYRHLAETIAVY